MKHYCVLFVVICAASEVFGAGRLLWMPSGLLKGVKPSSTTTESSPFSFDAYTYDDYLYSNYEEGVNEGGKSRINETEENVIEMTDEMLSNLNRATDLDSLQKMLGIKTEEKMTPRVLFSLSEGGTGDFESSVSTRSKKTHQYISNPQQAVCEPEMTAVDLGFSSSYEVKYFPTCIKVNRCGGCCPNKNILECQPVASEKVIVKVLELTPQNSVRSGIRARASRVRVKYNSFNVTVEEHTACSCMCRLKERDCDINIHKYDDLGCACICRNEDDESKCRAKSTHVWDQETCQCLCRNPIVCSSGEEYDHYTCSCKTRAPGFSWDDLLLRSKPSMDLINRRRKPVAIPLDFK